MSKVNRVLACCCTLALTWLGLGARSLPGKEPAATQDQSRNDADLAAAFESLANDHENQVAGLVTRYCLDCHSTDDQAGELDLERFDSFDAIRENARPWLRVRDMLRNGEMPPADADQLSEVDRQALSDWVARFLHWQALAEAGDPGPVILRRLSNAELTFSIQDLTGLELQPAAEFPADGAAGEGFANTGAALAMSPSMVTKYVDAAKAVSEHIVLLPEGLEFSEGVSRRDFTDQRLATLHRLYDSYADEQGRIPFERYLNALVEAAKARHGDASLGFDASLDAVAQRERLSRRFLDHLSRSLTEGKEDPLLGPASALYQQCLENLEQPTAPLVTAIAAHLRGWQNELVRFQSVGHLKPWQVNNNPVVIQPQLRSGLATDSATSSSSVQLEFLPARGSEGDYQVVWSNPRLVGAGRPDLPLAQIRELTARRTALRQVLIDATQQALPAVAELEQAPEGTTVADLASKHDLAPEVLAAWASLFGLQSTRRPQLDLLTNAIDGSSGYAFVQGYGSGDTPAILASSSDMFVRIPGKMKPHGVVVHPSPTLNIAVGWLSPIAGQLDIESIVTHAHPECGNGVVWSVELRRGNVRRQLAAGVAHGDAPQAWSSTEPVSVLPGDLISLLVGPRDGNHSCDLTDIEFRLNERDGERLSWNLTRDISPNILAGNPHPDQHGNLDAWSFYTEPVDANARASVIPVGSLLEQWWNERDATRRSQIAQALKGLLQDGPSAATSPADKQLADLLNSLGSPWLGIAETAAQELGRELPSPTGDSESETAWGLPSDRFGSRSAADGASANDLVVDAEDVANPIVINLPAELAAGCELVVEVRLVSNQGRDRGDDEQSRRSSPDANGQARLSSVPEGSAEAVETQGPGQARETPGQARVTSRGGRAEGDAAGSGTIGGIAGQARVSSPPAPVLTQLTPGLPLIVAGGTGARGTGARGTSAWEARFDDFRRDFPAGLCYTQIVPVDEVVTLALFHREDDALARWFLTDEEQQELNRAWEELHFISRDAITMVDGYQQLMEYATQDSDPSLFEPFRQPILDRAQEFRNWEVQAETPQLHALLGIARRAWRRELQPEDNAKILDLYQQLRDEGLGHEDALKMTFVRILVSPQFLFKLEAPVPGTEPAAVSPSELATRLSYFLWSSLPDERLLAAAQDASLTDDEQLRRITRAMLDDPRSRRMAIEFGTRYLHVYEFADHDEKSEQLFPEFPAIREDLYEETIQLFTHTLRENGSVLDLFNGN
ncbi:MAG: DUF1592 domain-containing protein, partial [Planctomycetales bacterium]|nr:DUF1592 domain-containing protein [Planctomycetales bacterium]